MIVDLLRILCLLLTISISSGAQNERMRRARNSNPTKLAQRDHESIISDAIQSLDLKLGDAFKTLESNLMERLTKIDTKINAIESKLTDLAAKITQNQADDEKPDNPIHVNVNAILEAMNVELITSLNEIYQSVDDIDKKVQTNKNMLAQNHGELMTIKEHLHSNLNDNISQRQQQQQRKERGLDHSRLLNDILSMVKNKLNNDFNSKNATVSLPVSSKSEPNSQNNNNNSSSTLQNESIDEAKTSKIGKGGIIFPSVKNKPSKINTTFITDSTVAFKDVKGFSCTELLNAGMRQSGVYYLQIRGTTYWFLKVFCEQEIGDGGWTVIQRRDDFGDPRENFNRDWADYKNGFGDPAKEFWMGNENIYMLTNNEDYALRIELEDFEGNKRYAQYSHFKIHSEADYYKLEIDGYEGNAGDSLNDPWYGSNNSPFSTYNRDNDRSSLNCASMLKGGWWWKSCGRGLNGPSPSVESLGKGGIIWFQWNGHDYALKRSYMMMKPSSKMT